MKRLLLLTLALLCSSARAEEEAKHSANALLPGCRLLLASDHSSKDYTQFFDMGECLGVMRVLYIIGPGMPGEYRYCVPTGATMGQLAKVVVSYMDRHPAELHKSFITLSMSALAEAFPCKK